VLFNTLQFLFFAIIAIGTYYLLPKLWMRLVWLLLASSYFYMVAMPPYIIILYLIIALDYCAAIAIEKFMVHKKKILALSILANLAILIAFKYTLFVLTQWNIYQPNNAIDLGFLSKIVLPIGLSFHTFQSMSYTIDVYRGEQKAERNVLVFANYVLFFPQLVAGPIERAHNMLHQFQRYVLVNTEDIKVGLLRILYGLFLKCVIADRLAILVDDSYKNIAAASGTTLWLACIYFTFQIYCDFYGYAQMAKGLAQIMGYRFSDNFLQPYMSGNIQEFWSRWHVSLSSWFRDYVYIPLGGNRLGHIRMLVYTMIVFILSGIWHGANYTFLAWGVLHGMAVVVHRFLLHKFHKAFQWIWMWVVIIIGWIFFRSPTITEATRICKKMLTLSSGHETQVSHKSIVASLALILALIMAEYYRSDYRFIKANYFYPKLVLASILIYCFGVFSQNVFIYFQF
jgi:alginate O-acetyltransferase complex protein AlgI